VRLAGLSATAFALPLRAPLHLSSGVLARRCGVLLEIVDGDGWRGCGEAALAVETPPAAARALAAQATAFATRVVDRGCDVDEEQEHLPLALRRGLEMATLDLAARRDGVSVAASLGTLRRDAIRLNALIGRLSPAATARAAAAATAAGYSCLKIKVDPRDCAAALAALRAARAAVGAAVAIRVDVNAGWNVEEAAEFLAKTAALGLEYIEQPVATLSEMRRLRARVATPLAADESIDGPEAVRAAAGAADVVVIKATRMGLRRAVAALVAARDVGLAVVLSSNLDSGIGIAAALQLSALLPEPARPCGLATAALWERDLIASPLLPENGVLRIPRGPGLGVELDRTTVAELSIAQ